jgi:NDP-sugar pyrophosphorylase family protein
MIETLKSSKAMKKKAMVLAAGLGTRLQDLTKNKPKALVEYRGKTLLEIVLRRLIHHGFRDIIINIHHYGGQIIEFTRSKKNFGINIEFSDETDQLLDTGGGIKRAQWFFKAEPVLVHNVDVYTDLNLDEFYNFNNDFDRLASFAVKSRPTSRPFLMDKSGLLCGWENLITGEKIISREEREIERIAYSGIGVLSPQFLDMLPSSQPYSLTPEIIEISKKHDIYLFPHNGAWKDMGKIESFEVE